jgi:hypothetical protein
LVKIFKKAFWVVLPACVVAIFLWPRENNQNSIDVSEVSFNLKLNKFDSTFFNLPLENFDSSLSLLREEYPSFFTNTSNQFWYYQRNDDLQNKLYKEVKNLVNHAQVQRDIEDLLKHFYYFYPEAPKYEMTTYISNLDFYNPVIIQDSVQRIFLATDDYLGPNHPAYAQIDDYLAFYRDARFIQSEVAENIAMGIAAINNNDLTLLNQMIWWGKIMYAKKQWLPKVEEDVIMRYDKTKWQFCVDTELDMWLFLVKEKLLFDTNEETKRRFVYLAPFSKFYTDFDNNSPGMVGQWLGLKIVESYMQNNKVSLQELMVNTDHKTIFNKSKYRP